MCRLSQSDCRYDLLLSRREWFQLHIFPIHFLPRREWFQLYIFPIQVDRELSSLRLRKGTGIMIASTVLSAKHPWLAVDSWRKDKTSFVPIVPKPNWQLPKQHSVSASASVSRSRNLENQKLPSLPSSSSISWDFQVERERERKFIEGCQRKQLYKLFVINWKRKKKMLQRKLLSEEEEKTVFTKTYNFRRNASLMTETYSLKERTRMKWMERKTHTSLYYLYSVLIYSNIIYCYYCCQLELSCLPCFWLEIMSSVKEKFRRF